MQLKIRKPVSQVYAAVVRPERLSRYFVESASGPITANSTVTWKFAEVPEPFDVLVREVSDDKRITFEWPAAGGYSTQVEITFDALDECNTMIRIRESGWPATPEGIEASYGNAGGWMHMMCCLKAWLEYLINLRAEGAL